MGKEGEGGREKRKNPNTIIVSRKFYPGDELRHPPPVCTYPRFPLCFEKKYCWKVHSKNQKWGENECCAVECFFVSQLCLRLSFDAEVRAVTSNFILFFGSRGGKLGNGNLFVWYTHIVLKRKIDPVSREEENQKPPPTIIIKTRSQRQMFYHTAIFFKK